MVNNTLDDNTTFWSPYYTVIENALAGFGIVSGCSISKGTGDWDIDVTSGTVFIDGTGRVSVSSGTVTISDSSGLSSGESRIDLITADTSGTLAAVEGTGATNPDAPDIPSDEVVLGFVVVTDTDSTAADSDIIDIPSLMIHPPRGTDPIYGDGSDGSITRSGNANENGIIQATDYTIKSGTTMTVSTGVLAVFATDSITIEGTIDADGQGGSGGAGGSGAGDDGDAGGNAEFAPDGAGGGGGTVGTSPGGDGGDGGNGDQATPFANREIARTSHSAVIDALQQGAGDAGAGGGGGGAGTTSVSNASGGNGSSPGGGGAGQSISSTGTSADGGDGGNGGGFVLLVAPSITGSGTITADGADGAAGSSADADGGGGGGGTGGAILKFSPDIRFSGTDTVTAGSGGAAGGANAGAGANGAAGIAHEVEI